MATERLILLTITLFSLQKFLFTFYLQNTPKTARRTPWYLSLHGIPSTYIKVPVSFKDSKKKSVLLINRNEENAIVKAKSGFLDEVTYREWERKGLAFNFGGSDVPELEDAIEIYETKLRNRAGVKLPKRRAQLTVPHYVNIGTESEPTYLKSPTSSDLLALKAGEIDRIIQKEDVILYTNISELFVHESAFDKADAIAQSMRDDYSLSSPVWKLWTEKTSKYNNTGLMQAISEYYQDHSIGDIGGANAKYIPKAGYPGTLAPGVNFKENHPIESLGHKVLHPWPAVQQIQWHVRWPPNHPMIPPLPLWAALNNMYIQNVTESVLNQTETGEIVGGVHMLAKDAIRIAKFAKFGSSYELSDQLPHGGSVFYNGHELPHYHPDHGPTVPIEQSKPPIPDELLPITERWFDPSSRTQGVVDKMKALETSEEVDEARAEEDLRRIAADSMMLSIDKPLWQLADEARVAELDKAIGERYVEIKERALNEMAELSDSEREGAFDPTAAALLGEDEEIPSDDAMRAEAEEGEAIMSLLQEEWLAEATKQVKGEKLAEEIGSGRARSKRALVTYIVDFVNDMEESFVIQRAKGNREKKTRRRKAKKGKNTAIGASELDVGDDSIAAAAVAEEGGGVSKESSLSGSRRRTKTVVDVDLVDAETEVLDSDSFGDGDVDLDIDDVDIGKLDVDGLVDEEML